MSRALSGYDFHVYNCVLDLMHCCLYALKMSLYLLLYGEYNDEMMVYTLNATFSFYDLYLDKFVSWQNFYLLTKFKILTTPVQIDICRFFVRCYNWKFTILFILWL